jgi:hypothetical protein
MSVPRLPQRTEYEATQLPIVFALRRGADGTVTATFAGYEPAPYMRFDDSGDEPPNDAETHVTQSAQALRLLGKLVRQGCCACCRPPIWTST